MTETAGTDLVTIEGTDAFVIFTTPDAIDPILAKVRTVIDAFVPDMESSQGRKEIASLAYRITRAKTYLDGEGKKLVDVHKEIPKKIDATRKRVRDTLDEWATQVRAPLTAWEDAEKSRVSNHKAAIAFILQSRDTEGLTSHQIGQRIADIEDIPVDNRCDEFLDAYQNAKMEVLGFLRACKHNHEVLEKKMEELERLKAVEAERIKAEHEAKIAREAAEKARLAEEEKRLKAEEAHKRREQDLILANRLAEARAEAAAEEARKAEERARMEVLRKAREEAEEADRREANKRHRIKVHKEIIEAIMADSSLDWGTASLVTKLIADKKIPRVTITY